MRMVFGLVLIMGVALAGFAAFMAKNRFDQYQAKVAAQEKLLKSNVPLEAVFTVKRQIAYGETLTKEDVQIIAWPNNAIPEGAFQEGEVLFPPTGELRTVLRVMEKDEAVMISKVTEPGEDAGVSSRLAKGMRAFAINVDVSSGVSGFLRPGHHVDVYWTGKTQSGDDRKQRTVTRLIENAVKIIAIDQNSNEEVRKSSIARTVTVAVTKLQGASLTQAQHTGRLNLSLVGKQDTAIAGLIEVDQKQLLGIEEAQPVAQQEAKKVCTIRMSKGSEKVNIQIPCPPEGS